jgi:acyl-CoA reductase-like NAD-dependent aldehyde dehydrogenase
VIRGALIGALVIAFLGGPGCREGSRIDAASSERLERILLEQAPSTETVRRLTHRAIDLQATLLKQQVDAAIAAWDSLPPEERRQLVRRIIAALTAAHEQLAAGSGGHIVDQLKNVQKY